MIYTSGKNPSPYSPTSKSPDAEPRASEELVRFASLLAGRAELLAEDVLQKLEPVMMSAPTLNQPSGTDHPVYPPLFNLLHEQLTKTERALNVIQDALSRTRL